VGNIFYAHIRHHPVVHAEFFENRDTRCNYQFYEQSSGKIFSKRRSFFDAIRGSRELGVLPIGNMALETRDTKYQKFFYISLAF
jgi:hypothetical protein